jgi:hypothetical protein
MGFRGSAPGGVRGESSRNLFKFTAQEVLQNAILSSQTFRFLIGFWPLCSKKSKKDCMFCCFASLSAFLNALKIFRAFEKFFEIYRSKGATNCYLESSEVQISHRILAALFKKVNGSLLGPPRNFLKFTAWWCPKRLCGAVRISAFSSNFCDFFQKSQRPSMFAYFASLSAVLNGSEISRAAEKFFGIYHSKGAPKCYLELLKRQILRNTCGTFGKTRCRAAIQNGGYN